jgi:dipeptidyl aminopeptidase/acylaminoacyl peptidase
MHALSQPFFVGSLVLTFALSLTSAAAADLPPLIPREVLFGNPERDQPQISPDGKMIAYLAPEKGVLNVWVRTLGQTDDHVITADKKRGIRFFFWQPDSQHILYGQDFDGDENWHIYQTHLKPKNTRDLTPFQDVAARPVALDPNFPDQMLVAMNIRDRRLHDVYRLNLRNGAVELDTENPGDVGGWSADNNLQLRAAQVMLPDGGTEIRVRDDARSPWRTFQKWGPDETFGGIASFTPDNKGVYLISSVGANAARLLEADLQTGKSRAMAEDPQYDVGGTLTHPRKHTLEAVQFVRERSEWVLIDKSLQADFEAIRKARDGDFYVVSRDLEDKTWVVMYIADAVPVQFYVYDRATKKPALLFSDRPKLEQYQLAKMKPISFKAQDGMTIYGYLSLPVGVASKNLPLVLNVHGGPWGRNVWGLDNEAQWLANRGYAVLQINFRGSAGYGKAYINAGDREWAGKMHTDLVDGKNWAVKQGYADPKRACIFGGSYGGYATLVGLAFTPDEFVCGVEAFGPSNLATLLKNIPPYWEPIKSLLFKRVGNPESEEEFLKSRSPLFKADQIKVPLLIAQGANDVRVKQLESDQIVAAMRKGSKPVEYIVFPDEGHGFARPDNNLIYYAAAETFLAKYLGGQAEPPTEKEKVDSFLK